MTWLYIILGAVLLAAVVLWAASEVLIKMALTRGAPKQEVMETFLAGLTGKDEPIARRVRECVGRVDALPWEQVYITSRDGLKLAGRLYLHRDAPAEKIAVLVHGYRSFSSFDFSCGTEFYIEKGCDVLLIDQRAHSDSEGKYITFGAKERYDVCDWCRYLALRFPDKRQILAGMSMGATSVLLAAGLPQLPEQVGAVCADCGFTSAGREFEHVLRTQMRLPPRLILPAAGIVCKIRCGFGFGEADTLDAVKNIRVPVLFIHGEDDTFVPPENTLDNYAACTAPKELILVPGAGHAMSFHYAEAQYTAAVEKMIDLA